MNDRALPPPAPRTLVSAAGLRVHLCSHGALRRLDAQAITVNLFVGSEAEGGPANLWLRVHGAAGIEPVPLLGPRSPLSPVPALPGDAAAREWSATGQWRDLRLDLHLRLAAGDTAWFWHLGVRNVGDTEHTVDLVSVQDVGLSPYAATRRNEYYASHYLDLAPLQHARHGCLLAARQNLAVGARHPWLLMGSLRRGVAFATDARQVFDVALRTNRVPPGLSHGLPGARLQHEHALLAIQDEPVVLAPGQRAALGCFGLLRADHPQASSEADLALAQIALDLPEAQAPAQLLALPALLAQEETGTGAEGASLFARAALLEVQDLHGTELEELFGSQRRHAEHEGPALLSFFCGERTHVVLQAKELRVLRPHGSILRSGRQLAPDEAALTSTVWMGGVFHSMVTQGHVSTNRYLGTVRGGLGQFRAQGLRVFVELQGRWHLLGVPSAWEVQPDGCRWVYKHAHGLIEVASAAHDAPHALSLHVRVLRGGPVRLLVTQQVALGGDDGAVATVLPLSREGDAVRVGVPAGSELATRFPQGAFVIEPEAGSRFERVGGDEMLYADERARGEPFVCLASAEVACLGLRLMGRLVPEPAPGRLAAAMTLPRLYAPAASTLASAVERLADIGPWYLHNALVHFLAPRGLEQFTGGGWGTRDVCQGPLEMLLALDQPAPVRDLLLRVFATQGGDGDWPQWFMFFARDAHVRADDSHGDIVFWPLLALARYLLASADGALLDVPLPFHAPDGAAPEVASVWQHVRRALALIRQRLIPGTQLAAYGHGDWNDSLQPADPALRENLCSAWTVTLHYQVLRTLARALHLCGRGADAATLEAQARAVHADFQRLLVADGVVTGYALFDRGAVHQWLLHPRDQQTGVHYSLLPMVHALLEDLFSPEQARTHVELVQAHLSGPDGARLFDHPLPYRGGPQQLFQRAESSAFFGREVGVMYTHAHLRWAEALAHLGMAGPFLEALNRAHPIALRECVPAASLRQANCYYSSSDAAFADRYEAAREYARVARGEVALDGGWRIYSSGPGIAIGIIVGRFLGLRHEHARLSVDPVMPAALDGLRAQVRLAGRELRLLYRVGPRGCGPLALELGGQPLPFARGANPYRCGAAEVAMPLLLERLDAGANELVITTE